MKLDSFISTYNEPIFTFIWSKAGSFPLYTYATLLPPLENSSNYPLCNILFFTYEHSVSGFGMDKPFMGGFEANPCVN